MTSPIHTEEHRLPGAALVEKAKELIHQGNVRRLIVKNDQGQTVIEVPVTAGVVSVLLAPALAAIAGIAALAGHYTLVVELRNPPSAPPPAQIGNPPVSGAP